MVQMLVDQGVMTSQEAKKAPGKNVILQAVGLNPDVRVAIGRRDAANGTLPKDPALLHEGARRYAHLPGGHQEAWADAFCNVMRDIYGFIASGRNVDEAKPPAFATFEDGYRAACVVDAILKSHTDGGVWTRVRY